MTLSAWWRSKVLVATCWLSLVSVRSGFGIVSMIFRWLIANP